MSTATGENDALDWGVTDSAGLAGAQVDMVMELEEAGDSVGVHVIGDRGAPKLDGCAENLDQSGAKTCEFGAGEATSVAGGAYAGVEESLVGIDVTDTVKKRLIE